MDLPAAQLSNDDAAEGVPHSPPAEQNPSQAASSRKLDVSQSTQAQVRYVISVEPAARAIEVKYA